MEYSQVGKATVFIRPFKGSNPFIPNMGDFKKVIVFLLCYAAFLYYFKDYAPAILLDPHIKTLEEAAKHFEPTFESSQRLTVLHSNTRSIMKSISIKQR